MASLYNIRVQERFVEVADCFPDFFPRELILNIIEEEMKEFSRDKIQASSVAVQNEICIPFAFNIQEYERIKTIPFSSVLNFIGQSDDESDDEDDN